MIEAMHGVALELHALGAPMAFVLVFDDGGVVAQVAIEEHGAGVRLDPIPYQRSSRDLAVRIGRRRTHVVRFELVGTEPMTASLRRTGAEGSSLWTWSANDAANAAPDLEIAVREVLIEIARRARRSSVAPASSSAA